jgi:hypothetical protein
MVFRAEAYGINKQPQKRVRKDMTLTYAGRPRTPRFCTINLTKEVQQLIVDHIHISAAEDLRNECPAWFEHRKRDI